jgi:protein-S-isoprenylcysteine O-methyltransferase Ste14
MRAKPPFRQPADKTRLAAGITKRMVQLAVFIMIQGVLLWAASGRLDWINAWVYLGIYLALIVINAVILLPRDPELIAERAEIKEGTKGWDKVLTTLYSVFALSILVIAGLDQRFHWSAAVPVAIEIAGTLGYAAGFALVSWAMASNRFFASTVRIQSERGHAVAAGGPYRFVRHPGYAGMGLSGLAIAVMLGSLWALVPAGFLLLVVVIRTALEDRTLQAELPGYLDYARRVPHRLLPGLW